MARRRSHLREKAMELAHPHNHGNQPSLAAGPAKEQVTAYSARKTRWLLWKSSSDRTDAEARYVAALTRLCPQIADAQQVLETFRTIVTERCVEQLDPWLDPGERSGISEVVGFARGLRRDHSAVKAALRYEWRHGPVEGHVNRLKTIERQMYGWAGSPLLRRRVLTQNAPAPCYQAHTVHQTRGRARWTWPLSTETLHIGLTRCGR